jgi:hypothetical protein
LPAQISRALYPADRQYHGLDRDIDVTDCAGRYRDLCEGQDEASTGQLSDPVETEAQETAL